MEPTARVEISGEALRRYVEPIEKLIGDRKAVNHQITAVYRKAKEAGFQTPILRVIIAERALDHQVWADQQTLLRVLLEIARRRVAKIDFPCLSSAQ